MTPSLFNGLKRIGFVKVLALFCTLFPGAARAGGVPNCLELFELLAPEHLPVTTKQKQYDSNDTFFELMGEMNEAVNAVHADLPSVSSNELEGLLLPALENAVQHGRTGSQSDVQIAVTKTDEFVVVNILNDANHPLPKTLVGKQISSRTTPFSVPTEERDLERGSVGYGVESMIHSLGQLYETPPTDKLPTMEWQEITVPSSGKKKILFQLKLPRP